MDAVIFRHRRNIRLVKGFHPPHAQSKEEYRQAVLLFAWSEWRDLELCTIARGVGAPRAVSGLQRCLLFCPLGKIRFVKGFHPPHAQSKEEYRQAVLLFAWSEWRDLNSRPLDPQSSALPTAPHPDMRLRTILYHSARKKASGNFNIFHFFSKRGENRRAGGNFFLYNPHECAILYKLLNQRLRATR